MSLESNVSVLATMLAEGSPLAREALKEVYQKLLAKSELEGVGAYQGLQEQIETAISDSVVNTSLSGEMTAQDAQRVIADVLGIESLTDAQGSVLSGIPKDDMAAALIALGEFDKKTGHIAQTMGEAGESGAKPSEIHTMTEGLAAMLSQDDDGVVFQTKKQGGQCYVPAETLAGK